MNPLSFEKAEVLPFSPASKHPKSWPWWGEIKSSCRLPCLATTLQLRVRRSFLQQCMPCQTALTYIARCGHKRLPAQVWDVLSTETDVTTICPRSDSVPSATVEAKKKKKKEKKTEKSLKWHRNFLQSMKNLRSSWGPAQGCQSPRDASLLLFCLPQVNSIILWLTIKFNHLVAVTGLLTLDPWTFPPQKKSKPPCTMNVNLWTLQTSQKQSTHLQRIVES